MRVIIDRDSNGNDHWIDTDPANYFLVAHPGMPGQMVGIDVMLQYLNTNPQARTIGGWDVSNQLTGESEPLTRWQRLVRTCNDPNATDQAKSLGLKE